MTFSKELQEARSKTGLSRQAVHKITKIPLRTLEDWEAGRREPPEYIQRFVLNELNGLQNKQ